RRWKNTAFAERREEKEEEGFIARKTCGAKPYLASQTPLGMTALFTICQDGVKRAGPLQRQDLVFHKMEADYAGLFSVGEMASDGVTEHGFEFIEGVGLGKDGVAKGTRFVAALWRFLDGEDDFTLWHRMSS